MSFLTEARKYGEVREALPAGRQVRSAAARGVEPFASRRMSSVPEPPPPYLRAPLDL